MTKTKSPVLVTGAAGFIGSKVVEFLLGSGPVGLGWDCLISVMVARGRESLASDFFGTSAK